MNRQKTMVIANKHPGYSEYGFGRRQFQYLKIMKRGEKVRRVAVEKCNTWLKK
jgi:hypothetical protein